MNRLLGPAALGLALCAGLASANGFPPSYPQYGGYPQQNCGPYGLAPGHIRFHFKVGLSWGPIAFGRLNGANGYNGYGGSQGGSLGFNPDGPAPYQLGPWYQYWPYEAHFQTPAMQQYPYWGAQTLPGGSPVVNPGQPGNGAIPPYWQSGQ